MLQDEEQQQYGVQDLRHLLAGGRVHFQGSTRPQGNDPLLFFEGSRNINILARPMPPPPPPLLLSAPSPHPPPHHSYHQYYDNLSNNINSILGGQNLQVGGGAGVGVVLMERTPPAASPPPPPPPPPPPCHWRGHGHRYGWNININNVVSDLPQGDGNINNCRWPRQETLTLLEIRSRLDPKFKEANHKAPLWDQLSRIMGEEHGYYRSGKKCREKFENLYKYYKKTKEGKAGRQDGKHYRFFRQLEALYGETISTSLFPPQLKNTTTTNPTTDEDLDDDQEPALSTNFSNTTSQEFDHYPTTTSSSENNNIMYIKMNNNNIDDQDLSAIACSMMMNMRSDKSLAAHDDHQVIKNSEKKINWKVEKVKGFVELEMGRLAEAQEAWMERMERMIGDKEKESMCREEEWTKQEVARLDRQHEAWAKERAWMEARDASFLDSFKKYTAAKFTHIAAGARNNATTSYFHPDMINNNNNLSCVGSSSRLAEAHEGQELWSCYELKKKENN